MHTRCASSHSGGVGIDAAGPPDTGALGDPLGELATSSRAAAASARSRATSAELVSGASARALAPAA